MYDNVIIPFFFLSLQEKRVKKAKGVPLTFYFKGNKIVVNKTSFLIYQKENIIYDTIIQSILKQFDMILINLHQSTEKGIKLVQKKNQIRGSIRPSLGRREEKM